MAKFFSLSGCMVVLLELFCVTVFAQGPPAVHGKHFAPGARQCAALESLGLSTAQREQVGRIESQYRDRLLADRQNLLIKRLELRELIRNNQASESDIRQKSEEFEKARSRLHGEMITFQLDIRKVLTPEQRMRWCTLIQDPSTHRGWRQKTGVR